MFRIGNLNFNWRPKVFEKIPTWFSQSSSFSNKGGLGLRTLKRDLIFNLVSNFLAVLQMFCQVEEKSLVANPSVRTEISLAAPIVSLLVTLTLTLMLLLRINKGKSTKLTVIYQGLNSAIGVASMILPVLKSLATLFQALT